MQMTSIIHNIPRDALIVQHGDFHLRSQMLYLVSKAGHRHDPQNIFKLEWKLNYLFCTGTQCTSLPSCNIWLQWILICNTVYKLCFNLIYVYQYKISLAELINKHSVFNYISDKRRYSIIIYILYKIVSIFYQLVKLILTHSEMALSGSVSE